MDPLSAIANIVAIIQAADRVISLCNKLLKAVRDAPSDIRLILAEVSTLKIILEDVQQLATENKGSKALASLISEHGPIEGCQKAILKLRHLLPPEFVFKLRAGSRVRAALVAISWLRKDRKVKVLLEELSKHKTTISVALTTDSAFDIKDVKANAEGMCADLKHVKTNTQETRVDIRDVKTNTQETRVDIKDVKTNTQEVRVDLKDVKTNTEGIYATLTDLQRQNLYDWLEVVDPSPLHNKSCEANEPGTGEWLFRSPDWTSWLEDKIRCLWVHGIPGAGKTVFASQLIEAVYDHCYAHGSAYACSYYYCYFGHSQDEAAPFLRWIIGQLCRKRDQVPLSLYELYRQGGQPNVRRLLFVLAEIVQTFQKVFVLVDALDESLERANILQVMRDLASDPKFEKLHLLATSREYVDIQDAMVEVSVAVSMRNPLVEEDIRHYVRAQVNKHPRMKRWPEKCRDEVLRELPSAANGMFRWAACQLQGLQKLKPDIDIINAALKNLPKTLDETYERALLGTSEEDRLIITHILRWMSTHHMVHKAAGGSHRVYSCSPSRIEVPFAPDIPCAVLLRAVKESIAKEDGREAEVLGQYALDEEMLLELCGCLITVTSACVRGGPSGAVEFPSVSFAHYTVLEFLESARIRNGPASCFAIDRQRLVVENAPVLFLGASAAASKWCLEWLENPGPEFHSDFDRYCAHSSAMLLYWYPDMLASSGDVAWLAPLVQLLEARAPNPSLGAYFWYPLHILTSMENPICPAIGAFRRAHRIVFFSTLPDPRLEILIRLLQLDERGYLIPKLLAAWGLEENTLANKVELEFQPNVRYRVDSKTKRLPSESESDLEAAWSQVLPFRGSVLEFWAQMKSGFAHWGVYERLDNFVGLIEPSTLMMSIVGGHCHNECSPCGGCALIQRLLQLGAKSTVPGCAVGSLQIAVATRDREAAQLLLEAGADPNEIGDLQGKIGIPSKGATFGPLEYLRGKSPMNIIVEGIQAVDVQHTSRVWFTHGGAWGGPKELLDLAREGPPLETLLVQYGAREVAVSRDLVWDDNKLIVSVSRQDTASCAAELGKELQKELHTPQLCST